MRRVGRIGTGWLGVEGLQDEVTDHLWSIARRAAQDAGRDRLFGVEEPRDRGDQPGQRVAVHGVGAAEVVDHLRRGHPGDRVAFAVRQLQIRHR